MKTLRYKAEVVQKLLVDAYYAVMDNEDYVPDHNPTATVHLNHHGMILKTYNGTQSMDTDLPWHTVESEGEFSRVEGTMLVLDIGTIMEIAGVMGKHFQEDDLVNVGVSEEGEFVFCNTDTPTIRHSIRKEDGTTETLQ